MFRPARIACFALVVVLSTCGLASCGDSKQLELLRDDAITEYTPLGAEVAQDASQEPADSFGYGGVGVIRDFKVDGRKAGDAAFDAFVERGKQLGWKYEPQDTNPNVKYGPQHYGRQAVGYKMLTPQRRAMFVLELSYYDTTDDAHITGKSTMALAFNVGFVSKDDEASSPG